MKINRNPEVAIKFKSYPNNVRGKLKALRKLILETAVEIEQIKELEETLKWGEPSYLTKKGSTIRINWTPKSPDQYAMFFNCKSSLVETYRIVYGDLFNYEKNRAIIFDLVEDPPTKELKECIRMALTYHSIKHLPLLGN